MRDETKGRLVVGSVVPRHLAIFSRTRWSLSNTGIEKHHDLASVRREECFIDFRGDVFAQEGDLHILTMAFISILS